MVEFTNANAIGGGGMAPLWVFQWRCIPSEEIPINDEIVDDIRSQQGNNVAGGTCRNRRLLEK